MRRSEVLIECLYTIAIAKIVMNQYVRPQWARCLSPEDPRDSARPFIAVHGFTYKAFRTLPVHIRIPISSTYTIFALAELDLAFRDMRKRLWS